MTQFSASIFHNIKAFEPDAASALFRLGLKNDFTALKAGRNTAPAVSANMSDSNRNALMQVMQAVFCKKD